MKIFIIFSMVFMFFFDSCQPKQQERVSEAQIKVKVPDKSNYFEREQIAQAEIKNDQPNKIYFWYVLSDDGKLIQSFSCIGRPVSSTESLEPNRIYGSEYINQTGKGFQVPLEDGQMAYTDEAIGMDGTFGDPIPFRYCMTPEGHYIDVAFNQRYIVSSTPLHFDQTMARYDTDMEAKKMIAQDVLSKGGCIDSNLEKIDCAAREK